MAGRGAASPLHPGGGGVGCEGSVRGTSQEPTLGTASAGEMVAG